MTAYFPPGRLSFGVSNMVSDKRVICILPYFIILSFVVKCLDKTLSYLFCINCMFLLTVPSDKVSNMINNFDIYVGFIQLGMLASAVETAESIS